jgi:ferric-dicitrate binding protein FerR (iron transport regulator)
MRVSGMLAAIRAGVLELRRRLYAVIYELRPARPWRLPVARRRPPDSAADPGALLEGFLVSELMPGDQERFESWIALDNVRNLTVAALRNPHDHDIGTPRGDDADVEAWWAECKDQMRAVEAEQATEAVDLPEMRKELRIGRPPAAATHWWSHPGAWAALAASIVWTALGIQTLHSSSARAAATTTVAEHAYTTARGERAVVTLDGATVVLGPESVLRVAGSYGMHDRTVSLTGHAYFDVTRDTAHPFRVWAHGILTQDIGTRFDLRAYPHDSAMRLIVAEGAVAMRPRAAAASPVAPVLLTHGMMATTGTDGVVRVRSGVAVDRYLSWSAGRLTFEDTPLADAVAEIGRWYDLDIRLGDPSLASKTLTATFDDPPAAVLIALESALGLRATQTGRVVTLYPP